MSDVALKARFTPDAHWYYEDGRPCYETPMLTKAGMKKPDIRDARRLGLKPSVTGVEGIIEKPALANWKMRELLHAAKSTDIDEIIEVVTKETQRFRFRSKAEWQNEIAKVAEEKWYDVSIERFEENTSKARKLGSAVHRCIACWIQDVPYDPDEEEREFTVNPFLETFKTWFNKNVDKKSSIESEQTIPTVLGIGGRYDLFCRSKQTKNLMLVDVKTTKIADNQKNFKPWPSWGIQASTYAVALIRGRQDIFEQIRPMTVAISNINPSRLVEFDWADQMGDCYREFEHCWAIWQRRNKWNPNNEKTSTPGDQKQSSLKKIEKKR